MNTCDDYQELVSAYADGETSVEETSELFYHLGTCAECRTFMTSLLRVDALLKSSEDTALAILHHAPLPLWKRKFSVSYAVAAVVLALLITAGAMLLTERTPMPASTIIKKTQTEYVYMTPLVNVVASPLPDKKTN